MNDFLLHLAAQAFDLPHGMQLRVPALFEPAVTEPLPELEAREMIEAPQAQTAANLALADAPDAGEARKPEMSALTQHLDVRVPPSGAEIVDVAAPHGAETSHVSTLGAPAPGPDVAVAVPPLATEPPQPTAASRRAPPAQASAPLSPAARATKPSTAEPLQPRARHSAPLATPHPSKGRAPSPMQAPALPTRGLLADAAAFRPDPTSRIQTERRALPLVAPATADTNPTVSISIGRIEVRMPPAAASQEARSRGAPVMTLDAYMRQRRQSRQS